MNGQIDYSAYGDPMPFGPWAQNDMQELSKALTSGTDINSPGAVAGSGFPLRIESLDGTLYNLSYRMEHLKLWPQLLKNDVANTVNEHNVLIAHGSGQAFFHNEGDLPGEDDSTWERRYETVVPMGTTRRYSIMASLTKMAHADAETHQTLGGTMWMLEQLERALFEGNSTLLPVSFNGYDNQGLHVRDLRGRPLTGEEVNYGAGLIFENPNFGMATDIYMPVGVDTDFVDDVAPNARYNINPQGYQNGHAGMQIKVYDTQRGPIRLQPNVFVRFGEAPSATALGDAARRPGAPTQNAALAAAGTGSSFTAADAGSYRYRVVAVNEFGKSIPVNMTGAIAVTAGQSVTFSINDGTPVARYYEIHRSTINGAFATATEMMKVARDASGVTTITDTNAYLPGTGRVYLVQQNREFNKFNRLLRFMKVRLGMVDSSYRFMLLLYGNLVVHAPNKGLIYINVGRANRNPSYDVS
jgi:hypothetical protein